MPAKEPSLTIDRTFKSPAEAMAIPNDEPIVDIVEALNSHLPQALETLRKYQAVPPLAKLHL